MKESTMPLFMDVHRILPEGADARAVAEAHGLVADEIHEVVQG